MVKNLMIVESKAKCKTIEKYINNNPALSHLGKFELAASFGHIVGITKKNGVDIEDNFKLNYEILSDKEKIVKELKAKAKKSDVVWLASDLDYEGENIAYTLEKVLKPKKYHRITFNEISKNALEYAILNPGNINLNANSAQQCRRALDRIVGYDITALLWKAFTYNRSISSGRTQSACLKIICDNEEIIKNFKSESYYKITADFTIGKYKLDETSLYENNNILKLKTNNDVEKLFKNINYNKFSIDDVRSKIINEKPPLPFITSSLQQEGSSKIGISIKQVMKLAQDLYEKGFITYMRTDSYTISENFHTKLENFIKDTYGDDYYKRRSTNNKKNAQLAHECVRVTELETETTGLSAQHNKLYEIIRNRTIASQMESAQYHEGSVKIGNPKLNENQKFIGKLKILVFDGFQVVYNKKPEDIDIEKWINDICESKKIKLEIIKGNNTWSVPPSHFSEATIVKTLELKGIGRPSTYTTILTKLLDKVMVEKKDIFGERKTYKHLSYSGKGKINIKEITKEISNETSKLIPTAFGIQVCDFLQEHFPTIIREDFTADVENKLDEIAEGKLKYLDFMRKFYKEFSKLIKAVKIDNKNKIQIEYNNNAKIFKIKGVEYTCRKSRYGDVLHFNEDGNEKTTYINLKFYLTYKKISVDEITEKDVKFLIKFPKSIGKIEGKEATLMLGPYSIYLKYNNNNIRIPRNLMKEVMEDNYDNLRNLIK